MFKVNYSVLITTRTYDPVSILIHILMLCYSYSKNLAYNCIIISIFKCCPKCDAFYLIFLIYILSNTSNGAHKKCKEILVFNNAMDPAKTMRNETDEPRGKIIHPSTTP